MARPVKPSELPDWLGDQEMFVHAHKPGSSERVCLGDISKLSVPVGGVIYATGSPGPDWLPADGSRVSVLDYPDLAEAPGVTVAPLVGTDLVNSEYANFFTDPGYIGSVGGNLFLLPNGNNRDVYWKPDDGSLGEWSDWQISPDKVSFGVVSGPPKVSYLSDGSVLSIYTNSNAIRTYKSFNGVNWFSSTIPGILAGSVGIFGEPFEDEDGSVYIAYLHYSGSGSRSIYLSKSTDGGVTWPAWSSSQKIYEVGSETRNVTRMGRSSSGLFVVTISSMYVDTGDGWVEHDFPSGESFYNNVLHNGKLYVFGSTTGAIHSLDLEMMEWSVVKPAGSFSTTPASVTSVGGMLVMLDSSSRVMVSSDDGANWEEASAMVTATQTHREIMPYKDGVFVTDDNPAQATTGRVYLLDGVYPPAEELILPSLPDQPGAKAFVRVK